MASVGIMGGTFNPIHLGHIKLAEAAYRQYNLSKVIFIPAGDPPHKKDQHIAKAFHRMNMVKLAISDYPFFEASDMEIEREGYSYTYETLKALKSQNSKDQYYFIIGADSLFQIETWYRPQDILNLCILLVADRDEIPGEIFNSKINELNSKYNADIRSIDIPNMDISSTAIRNALSDNNLSASDNIDISLLDERVVRYITENHLYCK